MRRRLFLRVSPHLHRRAGADQIAVTKGIINAANGWPVFIGLLVTRWRASLLPAFPVGGHCRATFQSAHMREFFYLRVSGGLLLRWNLHSPLLNAARVWAHSPLSCIEQVTLVALTNRCKVMASGRMDASYRGSGGYLFCATRYA